MLLHVIATETFGTATSKQGAQAWAIETGLESPMHHLFDRAAKSFLFLPKGLLVVLVLLE